MAMSRDEIDDYTNSMHEGLKGSSGHLEIKYMLIFTGLGVICAAGLMYFVFSMLSNIAFDDLTDEEELLKSGGDQSDRQGLIDSSDGKCAVCRMDTKGQGSTWQVSAPFQRRVHRSLLLFFAVCLAHIIAHQNFVLSVLTISSDLVLTLVRSLILLLFSSFSSRRQLVLVVVVI